MFSIHKMIKAAKVNLLSPQKQSLGNYPKIKWQSPKVVFGLILIGILLLGGGLYFSQTTVAANIIINGKEIGYAPSVGEAEKMVEDALTQKDNNLGIRVQTDDYIEYKRIRISKEEYLANRIQPAELSAALTGFVEGSGIKVNGKIAVVLADDKAVEEVIAKYIDYQAKPSDVNRINSSEIVEEVETTKVKTSPQQVKTVAEAFKILTEGDIDVSEYTVEQDDSLWLIARKNEMLVADIIKANPELSEDSILKPGQVIKISKAEPYLTVVSTGERIEKETIPFDVVTKRDNSLGYEKTVIRQAGKDGKKEVKYSYTAQNGEIVEKNVLEEKVITEPVKQIIAKGPDRPVTVAYSSRGTGSVPGLVWPVRGLITSYYGYRNGEFHTGLDIDGETGQPYVAAAAGKVIFAGWSGNYGQMILIDHGNGAVTRYAHSSKIAVSVGQQVTQGQVIGYIGSTGRSTGSHLHFEVLANRQTLNPLNYL